MSEAAHRIYVSTLADYLLTTADRHPDRALLIFPDQRQTYGDFVAAAYRHARSLVGLGIRPGDFVGILMANCMSYLEVLMGCSFLGAVAVPVNARYKSQELAYVMADANLKVLVTSDHISEYANFPDLVGQALPGLHEADPEHGLALEEMPGLRWLVNLEHQPGSRIAGFLTRQQYAAAGADISNNEVDHYRVRVQVSQPAIMMYTSGTTAHPKGCPLSHGLLTRNAVNMNRERYFLSEQDVFWAPLPMFHMSSILPFLCCIDAGAALSSMTHFEPGEALAMMARDRVAVAFPAFPTVTNELINHPDFATTDLSNLRRINNVAPVEMLRRFQDAFPQAVQTGAYGLTEAGGVIAYNHPEESLQERLSTCGKPFPGIDVQITNPDSLQPVPVGERGEMWIKGYAVFAGYHNAPEKNAESFHDGWFRSGDLCSMTPSGSICYHGRIKDMLKVGGENVAALEIESHLAKHPAVKLAQVIGREDQRLQEVPVAFVELNPGTAVEAEDLIAHCRGQLASFKVPRDVYFVTEWPMSSTKVQKFKLKEQFSSP